MTDEDLGALCAQATRRLIAAERPLLAEHGLTMWGYVVLSELARGPAPTQAALAQAIGHDKTRVIPLLDDLERDGLISREPDPADRRAHRIALTEAGRSRHDKAQIAVRAMEADLLSAADRKALRAALGRLTSRP